MRIHCNIWDPFRVCGELDCRSVHALVSSDAAYDDLPKHSRRLRVIMSSKLAMALHCVACGLSEGGPA